MKICRSILSIYALTFSTLLLSGVLTINRAHADYFRDFDDIEAAWAAQIVGNTNTQGKPQYAFALAYVMAAAQNTIPGATSDIYGQYNRMDVDAQFRLFKHIIDLYEKGALVEGGFADEMPFATFHDRYGEQIWDVIEPMLGKAGGYGVYLQHVDDALRLLTNYSSTRDQLNLSGQETYWLDELIFAENQNLVADAVGRGVVWGKIHNLAVELGPHNNFVKMLNLTVGPGTGILNCIGCDSQAYFNANPDAAVLFNTELNKNRLSDLKAKVYELEAGQISQQEFDTIVRSAVSEIVDEAVGELQLDFAEMMELQNQIFGELQEITDNTNLLNAKTEKVLDQLKSIGVDLKALREDVSIVRLFAEHEYNAKQVEAYQSIVKARNDVSWAGVNGAFYLASSLSSLLGEEQLATSISLAGKGLMQIARGISALESTVPLFDAKTFKLINAKSLTLETSALGSSLAMVGGIANVVQGAAVLIQAFGVGGPSADELILRGLQQLSEQLIETEERIHLRFDHIDERLVTIIKQNLEILRAIAQLGTDIEDVKHLLGNLITNSNAIESSLNRLRGEFIAHSEHLHRSQLKDAVDAIHQYDLAYGAPLPWQDFSENMQKIFTYSIDGSRELPVLAPNDGYSWGNDWFSESAWLEQAKRLKVSEGDTAEYAHAGLDRNLDFVLDAATRNYGVLTYPGDAEKTSNIEVRLDRKVSINPVDFFQGATSFLDIAKQYPDFAVQLNPGLYTGEDFELDATGLLPLTHQLRLQHREIESLAYPTIKKALANLGAPECRTGIIIFGSGCPSTELSEFDLKIERMKWSHAAKVAGPFGTRIVSSLDVWGSNIPLRQRIPVDLVSRWIEKSSEQCSASSEHERSAYEVHASTRVHTLWFPSTYEVRPAHALGAFIIAELFHTRGENNLNYLAIAGMLGLGGAENLNLCVVSSTVSPTARSLGVWPKGAEYPELGHSKMENGMLLRSLIVEIRVAEGLVARIRVHEKGKRAYQWYNPSSYFELVDAQLPGSQNADESESATVAGRFIAHSPSVVQRPIESASLAGRFSRNFSTINRFANTFSSLINIRSTFTSAAQQQPSNASQVEPVLPVPSFIPKTRLVDLRPDIKYRLQQIRRDFYRELKLELDPSLATSGSTIAGMRIKLEAHARMVQVMLALAYPKSVSDNELIRSVVFGSGLDVFDLRSVIKLIDLKIAETYSNNLADGGYLNFKHLFDETAQAIQDFNEAAWAAKWVDNQFTFESDRFTQKLLREIRVTADYFRPTAIVSGKADLASEQVHIKFLHTPTQYEKVRLKLATSETVNTTLPSENYQLLKAVNVIFGASTQTPSLVCMKAEPFRIAGFSDYRIQYSAPLSEEWQDLGDEPLRLDEYGDVCTATENLSGDYRLIALR